MMIIKEKVSWQTAVPFITDVLAILIAIWAVPAFAQQFQVPSGLNALFIGIAYGLFAIGILRLRKLETDRGNTPFGLHIPQNGRIILGIIFAIGMMLFLSNQFGYLDLMFTDPYRLGEGQAAVFFVFAPSAWLGVSLIYVPVLAFKVSTTVSLEDSNYWGRAIFGLVMTNVLLILGTAQLSTALAGMGFLWRIIGAALLTLWFMPARWVYTEKRPSANSLISFVLLLLTCVLLR